MPGETIYSVQVDYGLRDKSAATAASIDRRMASTARSAGMLQNTMTRLAAAGGAYFGLRQVGQALIGFNADMEQARITMAGMMSQASGREFNDTMKDSITLVDRLQQRAKESVGTTADMVQMASMLTRPITAAGLGMKDLEDFTASAVVASRAFGVQADMAARDIEAALMGQLRSVDRFSRALLESKAFGGKYVGEEGRSAFNALSAGARASEMRKALNTGGIAQMAKAQATSMSGVWSTFKDEVQIGLGKVGLPLFQAVTAELTSWNRWITANGPAIKTWGKEFSGHLIEGFKMAKAIGGFLVEHKTLLMALAKAWLASKAINGIGSFLGAGWSKVSAMGDGMAKGFGGIVSGAGGAAAALAGVAAAAIAFAGWVDDSQENRIQATVNRRGGVATFLEQANKGTLSDDGLLKLLMADKAYDPKTGKIRHGMAYTAGGWGSGDAGFVTGQGDNDRIQMAEIAAIEARMKALYDWNAGQALAKSAEETMRTVNEAIMLATMDSFSGGGVPEMLRREVSDEVAKPPKINVTIQRIEVQTDDPDRFVFSLGETVQRAARMRKGSSRG